MQLYFKGGWDVKYRWINIGIPLKYSELMPFALLGWKHMETY